ncbi:hypothetical protein [Reichenbachiella versicolor]|uniref:hypothetical protein n=1 Tax=Reichenbachiella versicolor TaxID=1821036 RepID=UPI0013A559AE|nr:hypothetical protein [Reichenbachiella versicolor]
MKKNLLIFLVSISMISCTEKKETTETEDFNEQTPQTLHEKNDLGLSSFNKRSGYGPDIIQELFDEAVEKDQKLKAITSSLQEVPKIKSDSLERYHIYMQTNQNYWITLSKYTNQISDTTLKKDLLKLVETLKDDQSTKTSELDTLVAQIDSIEQTLNNLEILMKIMVTVPMMKNYQRNELPNIRTIESVKQTFDSSISAVKPYTIIQE